MAPGCRAAGAASIAEASVRALHTWKVLLQRADECTGRDAKELGAARADWLVAPAADRVSWQAGRVASRPAHALACAWQQQRVTASIATKVKRRVCLTCSAH